MATERDSLARAIRERDAARARGDDETVKMLEQAIDRLIEQSGRAEPARIDHSGG